jgi:acetate CoA/acetoacetate CoA-transferase alpha subunit
VAPAGIKLSEKVGAEHPPMKRSISPDEAAALIPDGASLMIGGFMAVGSPLRIIDAIVAAGKRNLTVIANDTARPNAGLGKLIAAGLIKRVVASHIGLNPLTQQGMLNGTIDVELVPQGTLAERIRAAGFGLGGVLTKTGLGTIIERGQKVLELDGEQWLYAPPIKADFALIHADRADYNGNLAYEMTATNFNPVMAMAAATVICEPREIVPVGVISPDAVTTPGVVVDMLIERAA